MWWPWDHASQISDRKEYTFLSSPRALAASHGSCHICIEAMLKAKHFPNSLISSTFNPIVASVSLATQTNPSSTNSNLDKDSKIKIWIVVSYLAVELDAIQVSRGSQFVVDTRSGQVIPVAILLLSAHVLLDQSLLHSHDYPVHLTTELNQ